VLRTPLACGYVAGGRLDVAGLIVKEKVGFKLAQELAFFKAAQKHGFVHFNVPVHQRANGTLVRRCAACRHQCGADAHVRCARLLQHLQGCEQGLERACRQWLLSFAFFVLLKRVQALGLKHTLGLVAEQHRITVKRDTHFVWVGF
jgi:hypothetical protein